MRIYLFGLKLSPRVDINKGFGNMHSPGPSPDPSPNSFNTGPLRKKKSKLRNSSHSLPIKIPSNNLRYSNSKKSDEHFEEVAEMVPPHLIVANRIARQMAISVCKANERTLKGRDLKRVRNSILRMTDFVEK
ncbi:hypothetical protein NE237_031188 [Protea cynaroides]|uniref:Uncharacterized protein n=1 Tax=Protea cynaroides TaxID=273540 RepID=A0A9Q0L123_9MAGN|nr:hypothetical protein NE237_031188 [Protea cynaroides]